MKNIIGVCGFGYSGSGAVIDFLKGYDGLNVLDDVEFSIVYTPDGIEDLYNAISLNPSRYWTSDSAIRRFITLIERRKKSYSQLSKGIFPQIVEDYLRKIIQVEWIGSTSVHVYQDTWIRYMIFQRLVRQLRVKLEKKGIKLPFSYPPQKTMYYSYLSDDEFVLVTRIFISKLLDSFSHGGENIVLDQPFAANNPEKSFVFFENPKAILVTRDPRDTYILAKNNLGMEGSFIPTKSVDDFVKYYKGLMNSIKIRSCENVLVLPFESLIYDYSNTSNRIIRFIGLDKVGKKNEKMYFDPMVSINNTQLFDKYPDCPADIRKIEDSLPDFLYDFSNYKLKPSFEIASF